jgi:P27 family predicted phage terminase small subunit
MPKRAKPTAINSKHLTKAEKEQRQKAENVITADLPPEPPDELSNERKNIYRFIYNALSDSGLIKLLDIETILQACITIDRLHEIDTQIDQEGLNKNLLSLKDQLFKQYLKIADLLCMSPSARAKLGTLTTNKKEKDPLIELLEGMDNEQ